MVLSTPLTATQLLPSTPECTVTEPASGWVSLPYLLCVTQIWVQDVISDKFKWADCERFQVAMDNTQRQGHFLYLSPLPHPQDSWRLMIIVASGGTDLAC